MPITNDIELPIKLPTLSGPAIDATGGLSWPSPGLHEALEALKAWRSSDITTIREAPPLPTPQE